MQPTQVAGFNQFFDDVNGTEVWQYAAGLDARLTDYLSGGVEAFRRNLSQQVQLGIPGRLIREHRDESLYRAYLYWTPHFEWAVGGEILFDDYDSDTGPATAQGLPTQVETWSTPLSLRYFNALGLFSILTGTFIYQDVSREVGPEGNDTNFIVDAAVGYRFPQRLGLASLEVMNVLDSRLKYQDDNFREFREEPRSSRFLPERTILGRVTLNF